MDADNKLDPNSIAMEEQFLGLGAPWVKRKALLEAAASKNGHNEGKPKKAEQGGPETLAEEPTEDAPTVPKNGEPISDVTAPGMPTREEFDALVRRSDRGDNEATLQLRQILDSNPVIWQQAGDLASCAELSLIRTIAKGNGLEMGLFKRHVDVQIRELAGSAPSPLENLAARRVVQCWLWAQYTDMIMAANNMPLHEMKFWAGRQDAAHRRLMSSLKMLTAIRALLPGQPAEPSPAPQVTADAAPPAEAPTNDTSEKKRRKRKKKTDAKPASKPVNRVNGNGRPVASTLIPRPRRRPVTVAEAT